MSGLADEGLFDRAVDAARDDRSSESEERWELVNALRASATREVFDRAARWCGEQDPAIRELGADVLGQLGAPDADGRWPFGEPSEALLWEMLSDPEPTVLQSVVVALGHLLSGRAGEQSWDLERLRPCASHVDGDVREAVAWALQSHCDVSEVGLELMLTLMQDEQVGARNWATFGVAQSSVATQQACGALLARLDDADDEVAAEALIGLARRKDERVLAHIEQGLAADEVQGAIVEAASEFGRSALLPRLRELASAYPADEAIAEAVQRCGG